jgi:hypothetical protein
VKVPVCLAWLRGLVPDRDLREAGEWLRALKKKRIQLPASDPGPIRPRTSDGHRQNVVSLDGLPYLQPHVDQEPPEDPDFSTIVMDLEDQGFTAVEVDLIIAIEYEKVPPLALLTRLGCDQHEAERRAESVRRRMIRRNYKAAVAHELTFLNGIAAEPWPED